MWKVKWKKKREQKNGNKRVFKLEEKNKNKKYKKVRRKEAIGMSNNKVGGKNTNMELEKQAKPSEKFTMSTNKRLCNVISKENCGIRPSLSLILCHWYIMDLTESFIRRQIVPQLESSKFLMDLVLSLFKPTPDWLIFRFWHRRYRLNRVTMWLIEAYREVYPEITLHWNTEIGHFHPFRSRRYQ